MLARDGISWNKVDCVERYEIKMRVWGKKMTLESNPGTLCLVRPLSDSSSAFTGCSWDKVR